ncbi:helix-turn-helix domain-containing protein [Schaalia sp. JY-X169]|uniref:helix-turn-helix domain-containing protein n=1 Tax=Schaalia sp. JY-X169 TaxID=2758572 RepID=UPI0037DA47E3
MYTLGTDAAVGYLPQTQFGSQRKHFRAVEGVHAQSLRKVLRMSSNTGQRLLQGRKLLKNNEKRPEPAEPRETARSTPRTSRLPQRPPRYNRHITKPMLEAMASEYRAGATAVDLSKKYGFHRVTIMNHLETVGIKPRAMKPTEAEVSHWRKLHADGLSGSKIAEQVGWSPSTVRRYVRATTSPRQ